MPKRPLEDDSCCVQPSRTNWQWKNKALEEPMEWKEYVDKFIQDYDELDASSIEAKRKFLKKYFIFGEDKDARLKELSMDPYEGKGRYILNDWMQCCQHRAQTCPANDESEAATDRFIAWLQGEGQTGDKLQVCMHRTNELGENLQKIRRYEGGRRKQSRGKQSRRKQSRRKQSRRKQSRGKQSRRKQSRRQSRRHRRSSNRNRLTRSRR